MHCEYLHVICMMLIVGHVYLTVLIIIIIIIVHGQACGSGPNRYFSA